jgi:very-short-patch-repair endonuclease
MTTLVFFAALLLAIIVIIALVAVMVAAQGRHRSSLAPSAAVGAARLPYARIPHLLTPAERDCFAALQAAVPAGYHLFAQVRLANLVQVETWARQNKGHFYRIQAKCVDFVLCDTQLTPRLVIELDDSSHNRPDRQARDAFVDAVLTTAGIPILHLRWRPRYDPRELAGGIASKLGLARPARSVRDRPPSYSGSSAADAVLAPAPVPSLAAAITHPPARPILEAPPMYTSTAVTASCACGQCRADLRPDAKFCSNCGTTR